MSSRRRCFWLFVYRAVLSVLYNRSSQHHRHGCLSFLASFCSFGTVDTVEWIERRMACVVFLLIYKTTSCVLLYCVFLLLASMKRDASKIPS
jgi:hypothetical protein